MPGAETILKSSSDCSMIFYSTSAGSKRISGICSCFFCRCIFRAFRNEAGHLNSDGAGMCSAKIPDRFMGQKSGKYFAYVVGAGNTYVRSSELFHNFSYCLLPFNHLTTKKTPNLGPSFSRRLHLLVTPPNCSWCAKLLFKLYRLISV